MTFSGTSSSLLQPLKHLKASIDTLTASTDTLTVSKALSRPLQSTIIQLACIREFTSTFSRLWECCWGRESVVNSLFCNSLIEGFGSGSGSIPLTNGSGSRRVDPDPDTDRNESTNVPISKLRIQTKPKLFWCVPTSFLQKQKVSIFSKNFGTKQKLFDVFQLFFNKSKTLLYIPKNFRSERERFGSIMNFVSKRIYSIFFGDVSGKTKANDL